MGSEMASCQELNSFSGYNTDLALSVLPEFMPTTDQADIRFMV